MSAPTAMLLALVFLLATGHETAATQHVRGAAGLEDEEEISTELGFRTYEQQQSRNLPSLHDYETKGEDEYSSCPEGYPSYGRLGDLLTAWSPNQPEVPEGGVLERLRVLNYSDPEQLGMAETLRNCEVPFKIVGLPEAEATSKKWTDEYLESNLENCARCNVMKSESNRFMFWHKKSHMADSTWQPPTSPRYMPFSEWRRWSNQADTDKIGPEDAHFYLATGVPPDAKTPPATGQFVADDLPFFSTNTANFFIPDVSHQKGIQCRFGARGIIAESHFDHGKNFVLMLRGRKRYLLNPPRACPTLKIIAEKSHPSFRHSEVDWSDESDWPEGFADAPALETVLEAGELLYIPSFWYHYIVSEGFNVQCNARSGLSLRQKWADETEKCMGPHTPGTDANNQTTHHIPNLRAGGIKGSRTGAGYGGGKSGRQQGGRSKGRGKRPAGAFHEGETRLRSGERDGKSGRQGARSKGRGKRPTGAGKNEEEQP